MNICLLTDFGLTDHYVGSMKAVLHGLAPQIPIIDLTHEIPPQDVTFAAFQLMVSYRYHAEGTLFICVVDPGVGSERKIIYVEAEGWRFISPDNGLLSWALRDMTPSLILDISHPPQLKIPAGATFHGRDIMAPVGGRIMRGDRPLSFGSPLKNLVSIPFPEVQKVGAMWTGKIIAVDHFGNLITNFKSEEVARYAQKSKVWVELVGRADAIRGISRSYTDVSVGKLLIVEGSSGFLEISIRDGNAAKELLYKRGDPVPLHFRL